MFCQRSHGVGPLTMVKAAVRNSSDVGLLLKTTGRSGARSTSCLPDDLHLTFIYARRIRVSLLQNG